MRAYQKKVEGGRFIRTENDAKKILKKAQKSAHIDENAPDFDDGASAARSVMALMDKDELKFWFNEFGWMPRYDNWKGPYQVLSAAFWLTLKENKEIA